MLLFPGSLSNMALDASLNSNMLFLIWCAYLLRFDYNTSQRSFRTVSRLVVGDHVNNK